MSSFKDLIKNIAKLFLIIIESDKKVSAILPYDNKCIVRDKKGSVV